MIEEDAQFVGDSDEGEFGRFAGGTEPQIKGPVVFVVPNGYKRSLIEGCADRGAALCVAGHGTGRCCG